MKARRFFRCTTYRKIIFEIEVTVQVVLLVRHQTIAVGVLVDTVRIIISVKSIDSTPWEDSTSRIDEFTLIEPS